MGKRFAMLISVSAAGVMALGGADRDGARETVTQTMTRRGVGGGDLSGDGGDSRE